MSYYLPVNVTILLSFFIFMLYILGLQRMLTSFRQNDCEMTFMFQYPQFVEIALPLEVKKSYPKYALYGYSEGSFTEQLRKMKFKGIPVLFIPGSSGSHKQGRSLASVSLRKSVNSRSSFHFNYFMIDFNEEQAAIFGSVLLDQTEFVSHCIKKVLTLYENNEESRRPRSVILIGHSFGGILAKGVFMLPHFDSNLVQLIISLASPHKYPLIQFDSYITSYYRSISNFWKNNSALSHINLFSLSGGPKDVIVRSDATFDFSSDFNVLTTAVPGAWILNDHLSIMWCKQIVLIIIRALFDSVDIMTKQLSSDKQYINSVFHYHFIKRSAGKKFSASQINRFHVFEKSPHWFENLQRQFTVTEAQGLRINHYVMIRLFSEPRSEMAFIEAYNINVKDWIYVCSADLVHNSMRLCETGENLSNVTEIAPVNSKLKLKRKFVYLNLFELKAKSFSHVIIRLPPSDNYMSVNVDIYQASQRDIRYQVPKFYTLLSDIIIANTQDNALSYSITLVGFDYIWQSYMLTLHLLSCKSAKNYAVMSFIIPWSNETQHFIFGDGKDLSVFLSFTSPKPKKYNEMPHPIIRLHLDPTCKYQVKIEPSIIGMFAQGARFYSLMLPAFLATVALLTVRQQLISLNDGKCPLFHSALSSAVRRYYIVLQVTILGSKILGYGLFLSLLPVPDFSILQELNLDSFFVTILMYAVAIMIMYSGGAACYVAILMSGQAAHKMALRLLAKTVCGVINWSEWVISALHQLPCIASTILISLSLSTCGALALWLGALFYFLKLCKMYEEYLDELFHYSIKLIAKTVKNVVVGSEKNKESNETESKDKDLNPTAKKTESSTSNREEQENNQQKEVDLLSAIHFHTSVFLVWLLTALLYIPTLLMWAKNYNYSVHLEKDPSIIPSIIVSACGAILWQSSVPKKNLKLLQFTASVLFILAIICIIYASISLYRLGFILSASLLILSLNQSVPV